MTPGLEPAFTPGRPVWPMAGMSSADFEPDDPDLAIPHGALQIGLRERVERHFPATHNGLITHTPAEPLAPRRTRDLRRKWKLALIASCVFHAAVALFFMHAVDEFVQVEGADFAGIALLGNSPEDQVKAGDVSEQDAVDVTMVTMLDAVPVENVEAQAVPVDEVATEVETVEAVTTDVETLTPVEPNAARQVSETRSEPVPPRDRVEAATAEPQAPSQVDRVEPEVSESRPAPTVTETVPEVLATDRAELVDDDNFVQKHAEAKAAEPVETAEAEPVPAARIETAETAEPTTNDAAETKPTEAAKVETSDVVEAEPAETEPVEPVEDVKPEPKAEAEKKPEQAKPVEKKPAAEKKTAKPKKAEEGRKVADKAPAKPKAAGNGGRSQTEARRGQVDGQEKGDNRQASRGGSKKGQVGNAAVSNYPGKVRSKLARAARSVRARARGEVVVAFSVGSSGGVRSARVARSSGVASVDQAALQAVRKASPFPPIPAGAGRSTWEFSVPLAFRR